MLHISIQISVAQATNRPATFQSSDGTLVVLSPDPVCFSVDTWAYDGTFNCNCLYFQLDFNVIFITVFKWEWLSRAYLLPSVNEILY